jgi:hypothetical protein
MILLEHDSLTEGLHNLDVVENNDTANKPKVIHVVFNKQK